uniref:Protein HIRA n=1 Tax=Lygus hesperus TaxID=30085 RepID=A0A0A9WHL5_LYGHE
MLHNMKKLLTITQNIPSIPISLSWRPTNTIQLLVGCIDGSVLLFQLTNIHEDKDDADEHSYIQGSDSEERYSIQSWKIHTRYVIDVVWTSTGDGFATGSHDSSICLFKLNNCAESSVSNIPMDQVFNMVQRIKFTSQVECICSVNNDGDSVEKGMTSTRIRLYTNYILYTYTYTVYYLQN